MKTKLIISLFLLLFFSPISADSENKLLEEALLESAITNQQKIAVNNYINNIISKKEKQIQRLEDKLLLSYGGKFQREKSIKDSIKNEIAEIHLEIDSYKTSINGFKK
jgi:hypothetical protein